MRFGRGAGRHADGETDFGWCVAGADRTLIACPPKDGGESTLVANLLVSAKVDTDIVRADERNPWEYLLQEMGCGSGMTCWRRIHERLLAGFTLPTELTRRVWCSTPPAFELLAGSKQVRTTDRGRAESKHHVLTDAPGLRWWRRQLHPTGTTSRMLCRSLPPSRRCVGDEVGPHRRAERLQAEKAYQSAELRWLLRCWPFAHRLLAAVNEPSGCALSAGWSNGRSGGCTNFVASASATNVALTFTTPAHSRLCSDLLPFPKIAFLLDALSLRFALAEYGIKRTSSVSMNYFQ